MSLLLSSSVPEIQVFNPYDVPYQIDVVSDVRQNYDYSLGIHQGLLSGSVGSAKTLLLSHLIVTHCLAFPNACVGIGRLTMPTLKGTLLDVIEKHLGSTPFKKNKSSGNITFPNGSKILCFSWAEGNYKKVRSYEFSAFAIEELTENDDKEFYTEILMRVRLAHVPEKWVFSATNPDDPEHWAYKHFIETKNPNIHVYYSKTKDNKFLPASYINELEENLDPKMALRMLEGQWLSISQDVIYYGYVKEQNYRDYDYIVDPAFPIHFTFDFNIGVGKPMSCVFYQVIPVQIIENEVIIDQYNAFHWFEEVVIEGARTEAILEEAANRDMFEHDVEYLIHGDATGVQRNSAAKHTNYEIITIFMANYKNKAGKQLRFQQQVPKINPPIRSRHNWMNASCKNLKGQIRFFVYKKCKVLDEGMRLTKLKDRGLYIEDDSKYYQHITTAAGYGVSWEQMTKSLKKQGTVCL